MIQLAIANHPRNDLAVKAYVASVQRFVIQIAHLSGSDILANRPVEVEHNVSMGWFVDNSVRFHQLPCGSASVRSLVGQLESASRASDGDCDDVSRFRERVRESVGHVRSLVERVRALTDYGRA